MTTFNFTPLYRNAVGFDHIAEKVQRAQNIKRKSATQLQEFPHFNIVQNDENSYQIVLALAGFALDDIDITVTADKLLVTSNRKSESDSNADSSEQKTAAKLIHQSISLSDFQREFVLADHVQVRDAEMHQGLLTINLFREVPKALQPRKVAIGSGGKAQSIN